MEDENEIFLRYTHYTLDAASVCIFSRRDGTSSSIFTSRRIFWNKTVILHNIKNQQNVSFASKARKLSVSTAKLFYMRIRCR